jgi:superfamily II DNA or RNA helicase
MKEDKTKGKTTKAKGRKDKKGEKEKKENKVSFHRRPADLELEAWQFALRKKFGEENPFIITKLGTHTVFSEYEVHNPETQNSYTVHIRNNKITYGKIPKPTLFTANNSCTCQDFRTNRLGLCKHISATFQSIEARRGTKKQLTTNFRPIETFVYLDYSNGRVVRLCIGTEREEIFQNWAKNYFDTEGVMLEPAFVKFDQIIAGGKAVHSSFTCTPDAFDFALQKIDTEKRQTVLNKKMPLAADDKYFDNLLKIKMFPYQRTGAYFAARAGRCLIADEMGLGKTVQAIAASEIYKKELGIKKILVICPTSLKYQWKSEIEKFSENTTNVVEGSLTFRRKQYESSEAMFQIMSYHMVVNDAEFINEHMQPDLIILDEAQRIKNFRTKVSAKLKQVQSPYCFVLTGTPLENKLDELYSVVQFIDQFKLPPLYRFLERYQITDDETGRVVGFKNLKEIAITLSDSMIRRVKKEVLKQLPKRMDKILFVPMTKEQSEIHIELGNTVSQLVAKWRRFHFLKEDDRKRLMLCLSQMRMVCDSTFILDQKTRHDTKVTELMCILEEALVEPTQKVVVFSQWERMTRLVAAELEERNIGYSNLHGGVHSKDRAGVLEQFQNNPDCRVFISTDAGGIGLNLQNASLLINLDMPWNPAILEQRIGRIYRMGQMENVTVINMVSTETIEHRMLGVLEFKGEMAKGVLDPEGDDTIFMTESKFRRFMENIETIAGAPTSEREPTETEDVQAVMAEEIADVDTSMPTETPQIQAKTASKAKEIVEKEAKAPANPQNMERSDIPNPFGTEGLKTSEGNQIAFENELKSDEIKPDEAKLKPTFEGDDDVATPTPSRERTPASGQSNASTSHATGTPQALIQTGMSFLSGLVETLNSPEKTQQLLQAVVKKDEATGKTYLNVPIENTEVVENALKMLGGLFAAFSGK